MPYTKEMEQVVREAAPFDFAGASVVGAEIGKSARSVIAKAKSLGLEYIAKEKPAPKAKEPTKAELADGIRARSGLALVGLEKASLSAIKELDATL